MFSSCDSCLYFMRSVFLLPQGTREELLPVPFVRSHNVMRINSHPHRALWRLTGACRHFQVHPFLGEVKKEEIDVSSIVACSLKWPCHQGTAIILACQLEAVHLKPRVQHSRCEFLERLVVKLATRAL